MPTDTQLERDLDSRVFRLGETLRTKAMVYPLEAPPTVESIREGERRLNASGVRLAEPHVPSEAVKRVGVIVKPLGAGYPSCTSDSCRQGRARCPTPIACQVSADPEDVHRWLLAWIVVGFVLGLFESPVARVLLAVLAVPALMFVASLSAALVR